MLERKLYTEPESKSILSALSVIQAEVERATLVVAPPSTNTQLSPTQQMLSGVTADFRPQPYQEDEVLALIVRMKKYADRESRMQKLSERTNSVIARLTQLVSIMFGGV